MCSRRYWPCVSRLDRRSTQVLPRSNNEEKGALGWQTRSEELHFQGIPTAVEVRHHPAARRMTLRVSRARRAVIVTLPMQCDLEQAGQFVSASSRLGQGEARQLAPAPVPFEDGAEIPLRGVPHFIRFRTSAPRPRRFDRAEAGRPATARCLWRSDHAPRRLLDWPIAQARKDYLDERVAWHAANLKLRPRGIAIRDQVSRWGSCSTTGMLSFSWRLILAPPLISRLCRGARGGASRRNESRPSVLALVRKTMPRMDEAKEWLRVYGMDLHRFGPEA